MPCETRPGNRSKLGGNRRPPKRKMSEFDSVVYEIRLLQSANASRLFELARTPSARWYCCARWRSFGVRKRPSMLQRKPVRNGWDNGRSGLGY